MIIQNKDVRVGELITQKPNAKTGEPYQIWLIYYAGECLELTYHPNIDKVEISSRSQEIGSVVEKISNYEYEGNKLDISFSAQYIIDAIKAIGSNDVELSLNGEMKPFIVKNREDDSIIQLVLPVRTYQ